MLADLVPPDCIRLNHKLTGPGHAPDGTVRMIFSNGEAAVADAVIGADGVHSVVREFMLGKEQPRFTGRVAYRTVFPASRLGNLQPGACVKWWGSDRHIVSYFVNPRRDELYFVTSTPERKGGKHSGLMAARPLRVGPRSAADVAVATWHATHQSDVCAGSGARCHRALRRRDAADGVVDLAYRLAPVASGRV